MSDDQYFFGTEKKDEEKKEPITLEQPSIPSPAPEKPSKPKQTKENKKKLKIKGHYNNKQKVVAQVIYVAIVIATIITIIGLIWTVFDLFMSSGKFSVFLSLSLGYQIAIIGGFLAGFFFLLIFFWGLSSKGINAILHVTFKPREIEEQYQNRFIVKLFAGALMLSVFAIIIGMIISVFVEILFGSSSGTSITTLISNFPTTGPFILFLGGFLLLLVGLVFAFNWLWYNGYYLLLRLVTDLEKEHED